MDDSVDTGRAGGDGSDANSILTSTSSFSSALSSSDLDTGSSTSFFQERSITLGSLIGIAGEAILANDDHDAPGNQATPMHLPRSATSSQSLSFTHESGIRGGAKLCRLLPCGACKGLCYTSRDTCRVLWCAKKSNTHVGQPATSLFSAPLGHLLVAERDAERSQERDVDGWNNGARVYINIMFEENTGLEQAAINPLFDIHSTSTRQVNSTSAAEQVLDHRRQRPNLSREPGLSASFCVEDEPHVKVGERTRRTVSKSRYASATPGRPPMLPMKGQKRLSTSLCELGCVSYMWTRCRV